MLFVRSAVENGDHYIRTLVGGSLTLLHRGSGLGLGRGAVLAAGLCGPAGAGARRWPYGKARGWCCAATVVSCLLAVAGCLLWTPTHYETLYGLQGRYFLPVLPLLLLTCLPRRLAAIARRGYGAVPPDSGSGAGAGGRCGQYHAGSDCTIKGLHYGYLLLLPQYLPTPGGVEAVYLESGAAVRRG